MTAQSREYLKARFEQNDTPTAQDFLDLIDSFVLVGDDHVVHNDEIVTHDGTLVTLT